ncbi:phage portal protein [Pseudooceanicola sp. CBS1P-1]|uniref:Phage portal protein n=1 Tax=Pseudooceanicola albus TaxID=2692189 RepID=A0A6L7GEL0_9RHOB|nr:MULTISPECIES: phage portal protein [Pseudooceanicola]MBT9386966.1 phage portal protein [Pseudooceanicola endophyticus]MXN21183.1 phage portal protein [Pseudooceanicola albus]
MANWIDRTVLSLAPEHGARRIAARARAQVLMNYDAAKKGRRSYGWAAPATDADTAAGRSRRQLRNLSRDFIRNRSLAVRGQAVVTGNVVGTGIMPSVRAATPEAAVEAMAVIRDHLLTSAIDTHGVEALPGLQRQVMNAVFSDGEILIRRRMRDLRHEPDLRLPFQVELLEVDYLDETLTSYGRNEVIEGIEYGPTGKAVAYHLYDMHPGDGLHLKGARFTSRRVPAQQILHVRRIDRPGQMRGVPWLAPVMMTIGELSDYQEAQILKQKVASLLAFFVEAGDDGQVFNGGRLEEIAPGAIVGLGAGQKVTPSEPPRVDGYPDFMREGVRVIATGLGLTYESFGDLTGVNFSSGRMGRMEMDRFIQVWQQQLIINQMCHGIARWTLEAWRLVQHAQRLPPPPEALDWTPPRRPLIDPSKEIGAAVEEIEAGLTSRQRKQREMGYDPDVIARERAEDARREGAPAVPAAQPQQEEDDGRD